MNINFDKYTNSNNNGDFAVIEETGTYHARLVMVRMNKMDPKFLKDDEEPRDQISFLFDVLNNQGLSCHVATKPCTITFTDRSKLPGILGKLGQPTSGKELKELLYTKDGKLKDIYCKVTVEATERPAGDGYYNRVMKITAVEEPTGQPVSKLDDWDFKTFGKEVELYDVNPAYETKSDNDEDDDFINKVKAENGVK